MITLAFYLGTRRENPEGAQLADRLICAYTRSRFSHVEWVEIQSDSGFGFCWSASPREGVVRGKWIDLRSGRWVLATMPGEAGGAGRWFREHDGVLYDWKGVVSHPVPLITEDPTRWYCSEACAAAAGLADTQQTPEDLWQLCTPIPMQSEGVPTHG